MDWIQGLQRAIDYMEAHLCEDINYEEIAGQAYSSSFHFQRIFHMVCGWKKNREPGGRFIGRRPFFFCE